MYLLVSLFRDQCDGAMDMDVQLDHVHVLVQHGLDVCWSLQPHCQVQRALCGDGREVTARVQYSTAQFNSSAAMQLEHTLSQERKLRVIGKDIFVKTWL
jgi:hypothetical protein